MCHCVPSEGTEIKMHTGGFAFAVFWLRIQRGGVWMQSLARLFSMRSSKSRQSDCSPPSLFLLMNCLESWQRDAHNSFNVTFRCHFREIIYILIYRKLSPALQECHFKVPSMQLHHLFTSSVNAQRSAYWYSSFICYGSLHTICEKWQCHIRPLLLCQAAPFNDADSL